MPDYDYPSELENVLDDARQRLAADSPFDELQWWAFPETWGSTALGFGGGGGQSITTAQTYVVLGRNGGALYWGWGFARNLSHREAQEIAAARRSTR